MARWLDELPSQEILDAVPGSFEFRPVQLLNLVECPISFVGSELPTFTGDLELDLYLDSLISSL